MKIVKIGQAINKFAHKPSAEWNLIDVGIITVVITGVATIGTLAAYGIGELVARRKDDDYEEFKLD